MAQTPSGPPPGPLPPASAEYQTAMHAVPGKLPQIRKWKMFRSTQGATHLDFGKTGMISKPGGQGTILLDHVKKEAHIVPAPAHPQVPQPQTALAPGAAPPAPAPPSSLLHVKNLGTRMIGGHLAEGKMYTFKPPKAPGLPSASGKPPSLPGRPAIPRVVPPGVTMPSLGKPPTPGAPKGRLQTMEVWTHTKLKVPVLTKTTGMPGLQSSVCKSIKGGEPPPSKFQVPPGYKLVEPKPPAPR
jgi:hypothetical protein